MAKCISFCDACGYEFSKELAPDERWMPLYCDDCYREQAISYKKPTIFQEFIWTGICLLITILIIATLAETIIWLRGMK